MISALMSSRCNAPRSTGRSAASLSAGTTTEITGAVFPHNGRAYARSRPRHIRVPQRAGLQLEVVEAALDHVADADDAAQLSLVDDRHMAYPVQGHRRHDEFDSVGRPARHHLARHQIGDAPVQQLGAVFREAVDDLALDRKSTRLNSSHS